MRTIVGLVCVVALAGCTEAEPPSEPVDTVVVDTEDDTPVAPDTEVPEPVVYEGLAFPELPFDSRFVEVQGAQMHYLEAGDPDGPVLLLTHGWPSWSYIWRNVIPHLEDSGRVIAMDLIGFGRSDKLASNDYSFATQKAYFEGFVDALGLEDVVLVVHDWGSGIGFDYAATHEHNVRGLVFMEAMMPPRLPFPDVASAFPGNPDGADVFTAWRTPGVGEAILLDQAQATEIFLPSFQQRELTAAELDAYKAPFPTPESRWPLWWVPNELPVGGAPADTHAMITGYIDWMQTTTTPMLEFHVTPGLTGQADVVQWTRDHIADLEVVDLGPGLHFVQEDHPDAIGQGIADWVGRLPE
jgi:haloalkane dehalogenase